MLNDFKVILELRCAILPNIWRLSLRLVRRHSTTFFFLHGRDDSTLASIIGGSVLEVELLVVTQINEDHMTSHPGLLERPFKRHESSQV